MLFPNSNLNVWSSSETTLPAGISKDEFDKKPVLDRFNHQLQTSGISTNHTMVPDFSWSCSDISKIKYNVITKILNNKLLETTLFYPINIKRILETNLKLIYKDM